ncbi:hypothetical protein FN846DRAFT_905052 [Sphaerosporella brunnea]|uniref:Uncharacterized protein n=1 Tax=Sphaerosporella brunnea TaxID=1250544 RepID=A0A5J5F372_9PEZI|nr:hypothetical protein FN846DRAFT_905052 [Sphaerosporella brunnea]
MRALFDVKVETARKAEARGEQGLQQETPTHGISEPHIAERGRCATAQAERNVVDRVPPDNPPHDGVDFDPAVDPHCPTISAAEQEACIVLSLLFLDTEVNERDISCVARQLHGLNWDEEWLLGEIKSRRGSWLRRAVTAPAHAVSWALLGNAVAVPSENVMVELARKAAQVAA